MCDRIGKMIDGAQYSTRLIRAAIVRRTSSKKVEKNLELAVRHRYSPNITELRQKMDMVLEDISIFRYRSFFMNQPL